MILNVKKNTLEIGGKQFFDLSRQSSLTIKDGKV